MKNYNCLTNSIFQQGSFSIVPLRYEDRLDILKWRNEQIYHLRQNKPLTVEDQENYFNTVVDALFDQVQPNQILFSYLENDICIGYGGLVHINWIDKNAEISFIMNTDLEKENFQNHWSIYLGLIEKVAFEELSFHKIFVYAFNLRPHLNIALESSGYIEDARLKEHCFFNNKFIDVLIYSKFLSYEN
jgi:RimJ/RimL family protein N-acetyltransferase